MKGENRNWVAIKRKRKGKSRAYNILFFDR